MKFQRAAIASIGYCLPPEVITSESIEHRLEPLYERLRLPVGRLELMSGIRERRLWHPGTRITHGSIASGAKAIELAGIDPQRIGCLIHASVCRDYLEPATACGVHAALRLSSDGWVYDLSNACLGIMNAAVQIASLIEMGIIEAGLAVGTENSRGLIESTIAQLNSDTTLTRQSIKPAFASLTIGSGSCAWLIVDREKFGIEGRLFGASAYAETIHSGLCQSDTDQAGDGMQPLMSTDSEKLLEAGIETGAKAFSMLTNELDWSTTDIEATVCHQVGATHRRRMLEQVGLSLANDFATFEWLGNTGSVALPTALGVGLHEQKLAGLSRVFLMGIGSGINSIMLAADLRCVRAGKAEVAA